MTKFLAKIFDLRKNIKEVLRTVKKEFPYFSNWADEIDTGVEDMFVKFLDEPTEENYQIFSRYWFQSTEPVIRQIVEGKKSS